MTRLVCLTLSMASTVYAQQVQLRPIDRATVRIIAVSGRELDVSHGSGAVVHGDGWVVTARHVVQGADHLVVVRPGTDDGQPAVVAWTSEEHDLAIVRYRGGYEPSVTIAPRERLELGQTVHTSGYPLDPRERWPAASTGQLGRPLNDGRVQLSIAVNPGNSGSPVVVGERSLVGIVSLGADPERGAQGIAIMEPIAPIGGPLERAMAEGAEAPPLASVPTALILEHLGVRTPPDTAARAERLRTFTTDEPSALALVAMEAESLVDAVLEEAGVRRVDQLDPTRRAMLEPANEVLARSPGARSLGTEYARETASSSASMAEIAGPATGPSPFAPTATYSEDAPPAFTFAALGWLGMNIDDHPNADDVDGGGIGASAAARLAWLHFEVVRWRIVGGIDVGIGGWRNAVTFTFLATIGTRIEIGPEREGAGFIEASWTPGFALAEERDHSVVLGYRAGAGFDYGMLEIGVWWSELGREADSVLRTLSVSAGAELP